MTAYGYQNCIALSEGGVQGKAKISVKKIINVFRIYYDILCDYIKIAHAKAKQRVFFVFILFLS